MKKEWIKRGIICVLVVVVSWFVGALLECLVYCIPTDIIRKNISRGINIYSSETDFYMYSEDYLTTMNDNDSDSVILCETAYSTGHPLYDAMRSAYPGGNASRVNNIIAWSNFHDDDFSITDYSRYWHGYVTVFKPLFCLFTFADMRVLKYIVEMAIYGFLGLQIICNKNLGKEYSVAYLSLLVLLNPIIISLAFQYMPCTYIALLTSIVILRYSVKVWDESLIYIMLGSGILTSFFDFLTFPVITLGIPLTLTLIYEGTVSRKIKHMIAASVSWAFGYLGMWSGKWILSSVVTGNNIITEAFKYVKHRTGNTEPDTTRFGALFAVTRVLIKRPYVLFFFIVAVYLFIKYILPLIKKKKIVAMLKQLIPFAILAMYSVVWILLTFQHCYENQKFTYRNYGIMIFALIVGIVYSGNYVMVTENNSDIKEIGNE